MTIAALVISCGLFLYLLAALAAPEWFE